MGEFFKKYGSTIISGGIITGLFAMIGGSIASVVRNDKRSLKWYKKQDEIQQEQLTYWKKKKREGVLMAPPFFFLSELCEEGWSETERALIYIFAFGTHCFMKLDKEGTL